MVVYRKMLTKDEQKNQNADAQKDGVQNTNLDDVLLGKRVKIARKAKRLTQEELASLCDCTPTHICNIENGKIGISLDLLFKISILLGKSMDYFVMDNPGADPQVKINAEIAPKLAQCNQQMLDIVDTMLDMVQHGWKTPVSACWHSLLRSPSEHSVPFSKMGKTRLPHRKNRRCLRPTHSTA